MPIIPSLLLATLLFLGQESSSPDQPKDTSGMAVDQYGKLADDPTRNVLDLAAAAAKRGDDLRSADLRYLELAIKRLDDIRAAELSRIDQLQEVHVLRVNEQLAIRAEYEERLTLAEAKRIDANRAGDANAIGVASQRAADQALVLAAQVSTSAEALRALVATTAATVAASQQQLSTTLSTRLTTLEQAQYEGKGKQSYSDPATERLIAQVAAMQQLQLTTTGKSEGYGNMVGYAFGGLGVLLAVAAFLKTQQDKKPSWLERPPNGYYSNGSQQSSNQPGPPTH